MEKNAEESWKKREGNARKHTHTHTHMKQWENDIENVTSHVRAFSRAVGWRQSYRHVEKQKKEIICENKWKT